jgi:hypothetical protein
MAKGNMADQSKRPEYEQGHEDCPEHKIVSAGACNIAKDKT